MSKNKFIVVILLSLAFCLLWFTSYILHIKGCDWWGVLPIIFTCIFGMFILIAASSEILIKNK